MDMGKRTTRLLYAFCFIAGIAAGVVVTRALDQAKEEALYHRSKDRRMSGAAGLRLTNPLLECCEDCVPRTNLNGVKPRLKVFIQRCLETGEANKVAVYIRDLNNGPWVGINEKELFSPASLLKIPVMMTYLRMADRNPAVLQRKIFTSEPVAASEQRIRPDTTIEVGREYTVQELITRMIVDSDNVAQRMLSAAVGQEALLHIYRDIGLESPSMEDFLSVRDYASFFRILYNASYISSGLSEWALGTLLQTKMKDGIRAGVPLSVPVASKFGEREFNDGLIQFHECGIIYLDASPYILCVMTRGSDMKALQKIVAEISRMVYTFLQEHRSS